MTDHTMDCRCSILSAREEKLLDDRGVEVRLVCNVCGSILDREALSAPAVATPTRRSTHAAPPAALSVERTV